MNYTYKFNGYSVGVVPPDFNSSMLWIIHSNQIPPHIGFSTADSYFSLKATGVDFNLQANRVFHSLYRKQGEFVLVELNQSFDIEQVKKEFQENSVIFNGKNTCLSPIKQLFGVQNHLMLPDLLIYLEKNQLISSIFAFNVSDSQLGIKSYTQADIDERIENLQRAARRKS